MPTTEASTMTDCSSPRVVPSAEPVVESSKQIDKRIHITWGNILFFMIHLGTLGIFVIKVDWIGIALALGLFVIRTFSITGGFHRYFAHHSFKTNRFIQFCLAFVGGTCAQKGMLWWVAHHRHHHQHSDTEHDVHSAKCEGFYWAHLGWLLSREYHAAYDPRAVKDWTKYPELVWLDKYHLIPPIMLAVGCFLAYGWVGLIWGFCLSTVLLYHATFSINSVCHMFGKTRYATGESSRNTWWLALFTLGESWHNNHHRFPRSSRHGLYWWELDLTYLGLKALNAVGVIRDLKEVSVHDSES
jgi:stearoyl-CoA desaturase (Delta-9 desaturase)